MPLNPFKKRTPDPTYQVLVDEPLELNSPLRPLEDALRKLPIEDGLHVELAELNAILARAYKYEPESQRAIVLLADDINHMVDAILSIPAKPNKSKPKKEKNAIKAARQAAQDKAEACIVDFVTHAREIPCLQKSYWQYLARAVGYVAIAAVGAVSGAALGAVVGGAIMAFVTAPAGGIGGVAGFIHGAIYGGPLGLKIGCMAGAALLGAVNLPACHYVLFKPKSLIDRAEKAAEKIAKRHSANCKVEVVVPASLAAEAAAVANDNAFSTTGKRMSSLSLKKR